MSKIEQVLKQIKKYPDSKIPLSDLAKILSVGFHLLLGKSARKEFPRYKVVGKWCVTKRTANKLANQHRTYYSGLKTTREVSQMLGVSYSMISHLILSRDLETSIDLYGRIRCPEESVDFLEKTAREVSAKDTFVKNGITHYSLPKLAKDMALNVAKKSDKKQYNKESERIYKCIYNWISEGVIPHIKTSGGTSIYVPESVYDDLVSMVRIIDTSRLCDMSRRSMYNWIDKGLLKTTKTASGYTMVSIKDLDIALKFNFQKELLKLFRLDNKKLEEISDENSYFWSGVIASKNKGELFGKIVMDAGKVRAIKSISKDRSKNFTTFSLDRSISKENGKTTFLDTMADKSETGDKDFPELYDSIESLEPDDRELLLVAFELSGNVTMEDIAEKRGVTIESLYSSVDPAVEKLKYSYVNNLKTELVDE